MPEIILPGTYITVRDEGLITAGRVATGNIGIVGTAAKGPLNTVQIIGSFSEAQEIFGSKGPIPDPNNPKELTLVRAIEQIYNNGGRTVYAVRTAGKAAQTSPKTAKLVLKNGGTPSTDILELTALSEGEWGNSISIKISLPEGAANNSLDRVLEISEGVLKERFLGNSANALANSLTSSRLVSAKVLNGGATPPAVIAASLSGGANGQNATAADYATSLALLEKDIINIVVLAGQPVTDSGMAVALQGHINNTAENKRERIAIMGCNGSTNVDTIINSNTLSSDRIIFVAPGIRNGNENLSGAYTAAAVAGLISSLPVQSSPTNKVLTIGGLAEEYTSSKLEKLVQNRVLAVERREGFRVVKGITTATNTAWHQITTRRIVDYAIYGVRSCCSPYIGKLNNERVRGAMKATLDAFLTRMVEDEALTGYKLEVSATRAQEIAGACIVTMTIQPTFSIDFVLVTMYLG